MNLAARILQGYFRTFELESNGRNAMKCVATTSRLCWLAVSVIFLHKHSKKNPIPAGAALIQLGGPAMLIGLGGGAASSMDTGSNVLKILDFDSVQRGNPELERRAQEVIDRCWQLGDSKSRF